MLGHGWAAAVLVGAASLLHVYVYACFLSMHVLVSWHLFIRLGCWLAVSLCSKKIRCDAPKQTNRDQAREMRQLTMRPAVSPIAANHPRSIASCRCMSTQVPSTRYLKFVPCSLPLLPLFRAPHHRRDGQTDSSETGKIQIKHVQIRFK